MGTVWAATHTVTRRSVAMKFLKDSMRHRKDLRERFLREAAAASSLKYPNVVEIIDVFDFAEGCPVMVMELLRGETLGAKLLRDERLSIEGRQRQRRARAALSVRRSSSRAAYSSSRRRSPGSAK